MAINAGAACLDRNQSQTGFTLVDEANDANATGTIDYVCIWWKIGDTCEVASFIDEGGDVLSTHTFVSLADKGNGEQEYNAPGDFTAFDIDISEYIGIWPDSGEVEVADSGGDGMWDDRDSQIPCSSNSFSLNATYGLSLYATGTEGNGGLSIPIAMHHYKQMAGAG